MATINLILAIDLGSTTTRIIAYDPRDWTPYHQVRAATMLDTATPDSLAQIVEALLGSVQAWITANDAHIIGVALCTLSGNLCALDQHGKPIAPLYTYANLSGMDALQGRIRTQINNVTDVTDFTFDARAAYQRSGTPAHPAYYPAQLADLLNSGIVPAQVCDLGTYFYQQWFGRAVPMGISVASWSGMLNRQTATWDSAWCKLLNISESAFPLIAPDHYTEHGLTAAYAARWPSLADVPFAICIADGAAANIGMNAATPDTIAVTVGTTSAVRRVIPTQAGASPPPVPDGLWCYSLDHGHYIYGGSLTEGGNLFAWARRTLAGLEDDSTLEAALLQRLTDSSIHSSMHTSMHSSIRSSHDQHLKIIPTFAGERSPGFNPLATGSISGLTLDTTPLDIVYALMYSVAERIAWLVDAVHTLPGLSPAAHIIGGGGALRGSRAWQQMIAQTCGQPIMIGDTMESSALGAAIALWDTLSNTLARD